PRSGPWCRRAWDRFVSPWKDPLLLCRFQLWGVYHAKCPRWGPGDESLFSGDESRLLLGQEDLRGEGPLLAGPAQVPAQPLHHAVDAQEPEAVAAPLGGGKAAAG